MSAFLLVFVRFFRTIKSGIKDPEFRALLLTMIVMLAIGTVFYANFEGWPWVDALYFSVITLATIGYGDLHPTTPTTKIFTIFYVLIGLGIFSAFIVLFAQRIRDQRKR